MNIRFAILPGILMLSGCFMHQPVAPGVVPAAGTRVSIGLTDLGTVQMGERLGPGIGALEGRVIDLSADTILLRLDRAILRDKSVVVWFGDTTAVPRALVSGVAIRSLDRRRTLAAVLGVAVVGVTLVRGIDGFGGGDDGDGGTPPPGNPGLRRP